MIILQFDQWDNSTNGVLRTVTYAKGFVSPWTNRSLPRLKPLISQRRQRGTLADALVARLGHRQFEALPMQAVLCSLYRPLSQKTLIYNNSGPYKAVNRATNPLFLTTKKLAAKDRTSIHSRQTGQRFVAVRNQSNQSVRKRPVKSYFTIFVP